MLKDESCSFFTHSLRELVFITTSDKVSSLPLRKLGSARPYPGQAPLRSLQCTLSSTFKMKSLFSGEHKFSSKLNELEVCALATSFLPF